MKGHVHTPSTLSRKMVDIIFDGKTPKPDEQILYPGVGTGPFIEAVEEYCQEYNLSIPRGFGIDTNPEHIETVEEKFTNLPVRFECHDFLDRELELGSFDFVIGNPPYVPIEEISENEKEEYRENFKTATGRFDLYILFFERALEVLDDGGRLMFVTPEKFEYIESAAELRKLLTNYWIERVEHLEGDAFNGHTTYPTLTLITKSEGRKTQVINRKEGEFFVQLPSDGYRWSHHIRNLDVSLEPTGVTLSEISERISPGIATGADEIFVFSDEDLPEHFSNLSRPTISGKELENFEAGDDVVPKTSFICPYREDGSLVPEDELGEFRDWAMQFHEEQLKQRTCYQKGKCRWYSWHENPPMGDLRRKKILFRDITDNPKFWIDSTEEIIPRHTVYYLIPKEDEDIKELSSYLNSPKVKQWLMANCQRAQNGYLRLQSRVIEDLPVPPRFSKHKQGTLEDTSASTS